MVNRDTHKGTDARNFNEIMELRDYQNAAVCAVYEYFKTHETGNPCIVVPTGGGKTPILAAICHDVQSAWGGRVLVISHVKELLEQSAGTLKRMDLTLDVGIYSAGLERRDTKNAILCAGIQSVYKKSDELGKFDLIIVDEAHLIPAGGDGMYQTFIKNQLEMNPSVRIIGLTATPYRLDVGEICGPKNVLTEICYEASVKSLIESGWLSPLVSRQGTHELDFNRVKLTAGEFNADELNRMMMAGEHVRKACYDIVTKTKERKSILIFACSVEHAESIQTNLQRITGEEIGLVTGSTESSERAELLARFRGEEIPKNLFGDMYPPIRYLVNVNVLTTGFDAPNIDAIALLRPTMSPGLYVQMVGRGLRKCSGKTDCLILDYGNNVIRHGCIDKVHVRSKAEKTGKPLLKSCPQCGAFLPLARSLCECGYVFPQKENGGEGPQHETRAGENGVISGEVSYETRPVIGCEYHYHEKKRRAGDTTFYPPTMEVIYKTSLLSSVREWLCVEHPPGFAHNRFAKWWKARSTCPIPRTVEEAVQVAFEGGVAETEEIRVKIVSGEKFPQVQSWKVGPKKGPDDLETWEDLGDF